MADTDSEDIVDSSDAITTFQIVGTLRRPKFKTEEDRIRYMDMVLMKTNLIIPILEEMFGNDYMEGIVMAQHKNRDPVRQPLPVRRDWTPSIVKGSS